MNRSPRVWVVGHPEPWVSELRVGTDLEVRCAPTWSDLAGAGAPPDALIVGPRLREAPGFAAVVASYGDVPLILLEDEDHRPTYDPTDRCLIVHSSRTEEIARFLATELASTSRPRRPRTRRIPALVRAGDESFVGRTGSLSEQGLTVVVPGPEVGLIDVDVALITAGPCIRFEARVERHLRTEGETHLGLVFRGLGPRDVRRILEMVDGASEPSTAASGSSESEPDDDLPDWVQRALSGLATAGAWSQRVLEGRVEMAIQLCDPVAPADLLLPTGDL